MKKLQVKYLLPVLLLGFAIQIPGLFRLGGCISSMPGEKAEDDLLASIFAGQTGQFKCVENEKKVP